jgi:pimeloyl-ACP methyl ester carboxylesterase
MIRGKGDGLEIQLAVWEGSGKDIIAVHGITANCRCWDVLASAISPAHRVIAMDLRGRGLSDKPDTGYSLEHHVRDILALLDHRGIERAVLMGHSLGAFIVLAFAAEHPDRVDRLVLVDGAGKLSQEQFDKVFAGIKPALDRLGKVFPSSDAYVDAMKQAPYMQPWSPAIEAYCRYEIEETNEGVRCGIRPEHIMEEAANIRKVDPASLYGRVQCRTLILRADKGLLQEDDILLPEPVVRRMIEEIPDALRFDVEGTNHYGIVFQPNEARDRMLLDFLGD